MVVHAIAGGSEASFARGGGESLSGASENPCLADLQQLAWDAGLVIILTTDASSEVGWGVTAGSVWHQGSWLPEERDMSINWKELKT